MVDGLGREVVVLYLSIFKLDIEWIWERQQREMMINISGWHARWGNGMGQPMLSSSMGMEDLVAVSICGGLHGWGYLSLWVGGIHLTIVQDLWLHRQAQLAAASAATKAPFVQQSHPLQRATAAGPAISRLDVLNVLEKQLN